MATNVSASTTPAVVNGSRTSNHWSSHWPARPRRPRASRSATPPTTGGSTMGSRTSARTTLRPGNSMRASSQASGTPSTIERPWPQSEHTSESRSASRTDGSPSTPGRSRHGARSNSPRVGRTKNVATASAARDHEKHRRAAPAPRGGHGGRKPNSRRTALAFVGPDELDERAGGRPRCRPRRWARSGTSAITFSSSGISHSLDRRRSLRRR